MCVCFFEKNLPRCSPTNQTKAAWRRAFLLLLLVRVRAFVRVSVSACRRARVYRIGKRKLPLPLFFLHPLSIKNSCIASHRTHIYSKRNLMAASTTSLSSRGFSSAQFVAGSRRPVKSSSRGRFVSRASSSVGKKEEVLCGENADESSTNIAGKAVSAVVAAAISLSSAGQAAVAQVVRFLFVRVLLVFCLRLLIRTLIIKRAR